jgi:hypothetical protein
MANRKKTPVLIDSGEINDLKDAVGSLPMQFESLSKSNEKLVEKVILLTKGVTDLTKSVSKGLNVKPGKPTAKGGGKSSNGQPDPKQIENTYKKNIDNMFRGITGQFGRNIDKMFGGKIQNKLDSFAKKIEDSVPKGKFEGKGYYIDGQKQEFKGKIPKGSKFIKDKESFNQMGANNPFGAGKKGAGGILSKAGGSLMRGAAGLMRAAGPIGAAFSIGMQVVDFFDSGKAAQMSSDIATFFGGAGAGKDTTKALFQNSKAYRDIVADYNIVEPVRQEYAQRRDMMDFQKQAEMDNLGLAQDRVKDEYNRRFDNEADWLNFAHSQAMANIDAEHERRKTLFMTGMQAAGKYIGVSERALNAIGSSTEAVMNSIASVGKNLGASVKDMVRMSTAAAGVSKLLGASAEDVLSMGNMFRLLNKSSLEVGTNLTTGIKAFADKNGVMASVIMKDMTDSSAEIYKFSDGTAENFAKQAIALNKMGTSMNAMMKASDSMVLNYKDSIKAEMSLSAMLGKNVDLSETRAKLMSGDQAGAAESLRGALGGMDVGAMNAFQKQQLSQATGMDIEQLMSLQQGGEGDVKGKLEAENAKKTGAMIAEGALKQDVANEAKKIAMEQAQRAKMLAFEQDKRKGMLFIEQSQRLENLAIEQKWRLKYAALDTEEKIDMAVAEMQKESASKLINNVFQDSAQTFKDNLTKQGMTPDSAKFKEAMAGFTANQDQIKQYTMGLVQNGILTSENAGMAMADIAQQIGKGQTVTVDYVNSQLKEQNAFWNAEKASQDEKVKIQAEMAALAKEREEKEAGFWEDVGDSLLDGITFGWSTMDEENDKITEDFDKRQAALESKMAMIDKQYAGQQSMTNEAYPIEKTFTPLQQGIDNLAPQLKPALDTTSLASNQMLKNDDTRGMIFKKQYDYQAKVSNEGVKATYAVIAAVEQLAAAQGKPVAVSANDISTTIGRLEFKKYAVV